MSWEIASVIGVFAPAYLLFYLFKNLRKDHLAIATVFLGCGFAFMVLGLTITHEVLSTHVGPQSIVETGTLVSIILMSTVFFYILGSILLMVIEWFTDLQNKKKNYDRGK